MAAAFPSLVTKLSELASALREADYEHWAHWMELAHDEVAAGNPVGIERVLRAYGGMGSINDLNLPWEHPINVLKSEVYTRAEVARAVLQAQQG